MTVNTATILSTGQPDTVTLIKNMVLWLTAGVSTLAFLINFGIETKEQINV